MRTQEDRDEVTLRIASYLAVGLLAVVVWIVILVVGHLLAT